MIKGNCDAELILKAVSDFYTNAYVRCVLVTGDGDFGCLVAFLKEKGVFRTLISPDKNKCSILLRNKNVEIVFLNELYPKFSTRNPENKRAPDADASA